MVLMTSNLCISQDLILIALFCTATSFFENIHFTNYEFTQLRKFLELFQRKLFPILATRWHFIWFIIQKFINYPLRVHKQCLF